MAGSVSKKGSGKSAAKPAVKKGITQANINKTSVRKKLDKNLERERQEFKLIIDSAPIIIFYKDLSGRMIRVNKTFSEALNLSEDEILGKTVFDVYSAPIAQAMTDDDQEVLKTGRPKLNIEEPFEAASGIRWVKTDKVPILDEHGIVVGLMGFAQDITKRKLAEQALQESEKRVKMKLDAILSPQGDIGKLELEDILDIPAIQSIMDDFYKLTNVSAWILDLKGNIIVSTGWRDICTLFHRANIDTCENCIESDTQLSVGVMPGRFKIYKCKNNMWDLVTPITVGGKHVGNLFLGQFLFNDEALDYDLFRSQARRHGFNEAEYLAALERVPRFSRETIDTSMGFYSKFAHMISTLSYGNIALARSLTEKNGLLSALQATEAQYRLLAEHTNDLIMLVDMNLKTIYRSPSAEKLTGLSNKEINELPVERRVAPQSLKLVIDLFFEEIPRIKADPDYNPVRTLELELCRADGTTFWTETKFSVIRDENRNAIAILGEARDITDRKLAEDALRMSRDKYRSLVETSGTGIASSDLEGKITFVNATICQWCGLDAADMLGQPITNYIHPDDVASLMNEFSAAVRGEGTGTDVEFRIIRNDGQITWLHTSPSPIILEDKPVGFNVILQNITRRKQAEESLRQSEAKYRTVLEQIEESYYEMDLDGNLTFFNDALCSQLGYSAEELMGMSYRIYTSKDDMQRVYDIFDQVYRTGSPNTGFSMSGIRKDGARIFIENSALPLRNDDGKIIGFRGVARDITKRLLVENALRESEAQYRLLAEHTTDTVGLMDKDLNIIYISPSSEKLRGYTIQEIMAIPLDKQVTDESLKLATEVILRELPRVEAEPDYNPVLSLELEYNRKDGTTLWMENKFSVIRDESGNFVSILTEARDITKRREVEKKLEQTLAALEKTLSDTVIAISKMVEMKDPFTAGHQIRVAQLATAMAKKMGLTDEKAAIINTASTIHDIGKIYVPSDILSKPGKLNPLEYEIIQTHVRGSYEILREIDFAGPIAQIVYQHHERMDGSGYPLGLKGTDILPEAKILIVADVVEAMSSHRPYRAAMGIEKALAEITLNRGKLYEESAVDACLELFRNNEFSFKPA